jgi:tRNA(Ser,Leu) C12 N-acetylase TAN1
MINWNIVVTVKEHGYRQASDILRDFGTVSRTDFFNVMVMRVDDALQFVEDLHACLQSLPGVRASLARVMPVTEKFSYQSAEEFEACVRQQVELWLPRLAGKAFHVRMHRRGFKGRLSSQNEELFLDHHIIHSLQERNQDARINFDDPDFIIALETVAQHGGLSLWDREQRQRYPLLKLA